MISISPRIAGTAVLVLSTTTVHAQWHDETPAVSPAPRYGAAMTSTANTGGLLLFGGTVPALVVTAETWFYNGGAWTRLSPPTSPPPRWNTSAVFDSARGVVVLYGGNGSAMPFTAIHLADTWEWNGSTWTGIAPPGSPGPRHGHAACFDSARNRTVLFGGMNGFSSFATGTWEYDGATWSLVPTTGTPGSRSGPAACFHAGVNRLVLFGGYRQGIGISNDTWLYDGASATWTQVLGGPMPPARTGATLTYDAERAVAVLSGGDALLAAPGYGSPLADTWIFDGATWTQQPYATPALTHHTAAWDPTTEQVVRFGGATTTSSYSNQTWTFGAGIFGTGCPGSNGTPQLFAAQVPRLGLPYTLHVTNLDATFDFAVLVFGFTPAPGGVDLGPPLGMPGCLAFQSPDILVPTIAGGPGTASWTWSQVTGVVGDSWYGQALCLDPTVNPFGWTISNAIYASIGG